MNFHLILFIYFLKSVLTSGIDFGCPCYPLSLSNGQEAEISNCILKDCSGIIVTGGSKLTLTNVLILGGVGTESPFGSFIVVQQNSQLIVNNGSFVSLRKGTSGSAISIESGSRASISYGVFHNNQASANGGSISVSGKSSVTCNECFFSGNRALFGGAIDVTMNSSITWTNGYCKDGRSNAASCLQITDDSNFTISQVLFKDNLAVEKVAGIAVSSGSHGTLDNVIFQQNMALIQAADLGIYWRSSVTANNVAFYNSTAGSWSGSTLVHLFSSFYLTNGVFKGSYSKGSVGAISVSMQSYASTDKTVFIDCVAEDTMGTFSVTRYSGFNATDTMFVGGRAENAAGGWISYKSWATFQNCIMSGNQAIQNGGFLIIDDSDVDITSNSKAIANTAFKENGGFALLLSESYIYFSETVLDGNAAFSGCGATISAFGRYIDAEFDQGAVVKYQKGGDAASASACWHQDQGFIWLSKGDASNTLEGAFSVRSAGLITILRKQRSPEALSINPAPNFFKWRNRPCISMWNESQVGPLQITVFDDFGNPVTPESSGFKNIKVVFDKMYDDGLLQLRQDTISSHANISKMTDATGFMAWNKTVVTGNLYANSYLLYTSASKMGICYDLVVSSNKTNDDALVITAELQDGFGNPLPPKVLTRGYSDNGNMSFGLELTIFDEKRDPIKGLKFKKYLAGNETRATFLVNGTFSVTYFFKIIMDSYPGPGDFWPFYQIKGLEEEIGSTTTTKMTTKTLVTKSTLVFAKSTKLSVSALHVPLGFFLLLSLLS